MLFDWNLSRSPFLGQVVDLDLLLCTGTAFNLESADFFLLPVFIQRPTNDRKIERSNEHCFGQSQVLRKSIKI